mmetsp:Transcript_59966/g.111199  ORF Transcript_59966/g.111199 Transcript_59966/m.111199 type:complete len:220 (-) Transcript_59966:311-970(-)
MSQRLTKTAQTACNTSTCLQGTAQQLLQLRMLHWTSRFRPKGQRGYQPCWAPASVSQLCTVSVLPHFLCLVRIHRMMRWGACQAALAVQQPGTQLQTTIATRQSCALLFLHHQSHCQSLRLSGQGRTCLPRHLLHQRRRPCRGRLMVAPDFACSLLHTMQAHLQMRLSQSLWKYRRPLRSLSPLRRGQARSKREARERVRRREVRGELTPVPPKAQALQ